MRNLDISSEVRRNNNDYRRCGHGQDGSPSRWSKTVSHSHLSADECLARRSLASSYEHPASHFLDSVLTSIDINCEQTDAVGLVRSIAWDEMDMWLARIAKSVTVEGDLVLTLRRWPPAEAAPPQSCDQKRRRSLFTSMLLTAPTRSGGWRGRWSGESGASGKVLRERGSRTRPG